MQRVFARTAINKCWSTAAIVASVCSAAGCERWLIISDSIREMKIVNALDAVRVNWRLNLKFVVCEKEKYMSTQSPLPQNDPMLIAFQTLKKTPEYKNAVNWVIKAENENQADGELWFGFAAGYIAARNWREKEAR